MYRFLSEPGANYIAAHENINSYVKIATAAMNHLSSFSEDKKELSDKLNDLILNSGERWTPRVFNEPKSDLSKVKHDISKSGIIWVYSAFDVFFKQSEGILSGYFREIKKDEDEEKEDKVLWMYRKLGWETTDIEPIIPVYKFYKELRNCVAHNMGLPNSKIKEISESKEFKKAIKNWKTKFDKRTISPPPIIEENEIILAPHHTITYSETCRRIAEDINNKMFALHGVEFYIKKIAKAYLQDVNELIDPPCEHFAKYISCHLRKKYKIGLKDISLVKEALGEETAEELRVRYNALKSQGKVGKPNE